METRSPADLRRRLPAVDRLLALPEIRRLKELYGRGLVTVHVRRALERLRELGSRGELATSSLSDEIERLPAQVEQAVSEQVGRPLARVINATGIMLHTNLGRAPLPPEVAQALPPLVDASCDLEADLESGRRGERNRRSVRLLRLLTGAEDGLVANNNAACLVLSLATLAAGREVIVSRGELVEIGGSFRIPDILAASGARLVEIGTTNRTRLDDYRRAVGPETALLLKVHPSNYRIIGFTESVEAESLAGLGRELDLPVVVDEGAGLLRPRPEPIFRLHASAKELLAADVSLVCGSGDKLLGGPQAGLLLGRRDLVERCRSHPLYRALRPSRMTYAALDAVLRRHIADQPMPLDRLWPESAAHRRRLEGLATRLGATIVAAEAYVGGGAAPEEGIAGEALALPAEGELSKRLRTGGPPVVGYEREGRMILDLRTVATEDDEALATAVEAALTALRSAGVGDR